MTTSSGGTLKAIRLTTGIKWSQLRILAILPILSLLILWFVVTDWTGLTNPLHVPYPSELWQTVEQVGATVFTHIFATMYRVYAGFIIGGALGVLVGLAMLWQPAIGLTLDPLIEALRPIPALAFIPFFILWMGIGDGPKILLVGMGAFLTLVISTVEAIRNVPRDYLRAARTLGASHHRTYATVVLPAILPSIFSGIRLASALAFTLAIAAEFMGAQEGIGYMILVAQRTLATAAMLYGIILLAVLSFLTDRAIQLIGKRAMRWTERDA